MQNVDYFNLLFDFNKIVFIWQYLNQTENSQKICYVSL